MYVSKNMHDRTLPEAIAMIIKVTLDKAEQQISDVNTCIKRKGGGNAMDT